MRSAPDEEMRPDLRRPIHRTEPKGSAKTSTPAPTPRGAREETRPKNYSSREKSMIEPTGLGLPRFSGWL